jgi:hypothetical protein
MSGGGVDELFPPIGPRPDDPAYGIVHFDEAGLTYFVQGCASYTIVRDTHAELATRGLPPIGPCRASLAGVPRSARLDSRGSVVVRIRCPTGCLDVEVRLHDVAAGRDLRLVHQGVKTQWIDLVQIRRGATRLVRLTHTPTVRKRLREEGRLRVELRVTVPQPGKPARVFSRRLTLLP